MLGVDYPASIVGPLDLDNCMFDGDGDDHPSQQPPMTTIVELSELKEQVKAKDEELDVLRSAMN